MWFATAVCVFSLLACAYAPGPHSRLCHHCDHLTDPSQCNVFQKCHGEEECETEVRVEHGQYVYKLGCKNPHECRNFLGPIIGKRAPGHDHGTIVCKQCCTDSAGCNKNLCARLIKLPPVTAPGSYLSTTTTTAATTTIDSNLCQDFEDDNFKCSNYDKYHLCDTENGLGFELGHQRCQKHCGFCNRNGTLASFVTKLDTPSTSAAATQPMTSLPPVDTAETATSPPVTKAAPIMTTTIQPVTTQQQTTLPPATNPPATNPPASSAAAATNFTVFVPIAANVTVGPVAMSTAGKVTAGPVVNTTAVCTDFEDASFTCAEWSSHGFCQSSTGQGHAIAKLRCARYCGFCK